MNTRLLMTAACVAALTFSPFAAMAQQSTVGDQNAGTAPASVGSNSASNANSNANQNLINGGSSVGPIDSSVRVGPTTSTSDSSALSGSTSISQGGQGGSSTSDAHATGGSATTGPSSATSTANNAASNAGNAQTTVFNSVAPDSVRTVPSVYSPALTTTLTETCMGSTTAGGSWLGGGISLGSTWEDKSCKRRLNARELAQTLGDREAARAVMCGDADVADAYERLGRPCPKSPAYKAEIAERYMPVLPQPAAAPPPAPPVIINVPAPAPAFVQQPVPNPPEPKVIYRWRTGKPAPKAAPNACAVGPKSCPGRDD